MKKKITIELTIETDENFNTIETAVFRGLDYGFSQYNVTDDIVDPEVRIYNI